MFRRLFQQGSIYAISGVAAKMSGFILLYFYVDPNVLAKAEFGNLGVLDATKSIALLVASAGIPMGLLRFASSRDLSEQDRAAVPATALLLAALTALLIGTIGWVWSPTFASWLFGDAGRAEPFRWLAVYIAFKTIADVSFTEIRHRERAGSFVLVGVFEMAIMVGAILYFLVVKGEGLTGVMKGYALSAGVLAALLTPALLARVERRVLWSLVRPMLAFSLPLIASGLAARFLNIGDRYLITYFLGAESNAEYELAARFGGLVNTLVVQSFAAAFTVLGLKALGDEADPTFHRRTFRHLSAFAGVCALGLGMVYSDVVALLPSNDPAYAEGDGLVMLIAGGFALYGLYIVAVNVLYAAGRTRTVALTVGLAGLANLALNLALIPMLGLAGAALATLLAYFVLAYGTAYAAEQSLSIGYPWRAVGWISVIVAGLWLLGQVANDWSLWARIGLRGGLILAYPAALFAVGVYRRADWDQARQLVARWRSGREHERSTPPEGPGSR
ncbi:MAG: flippase [Rubricoccaceae bacterium]